MASGSSLGKNNLNFSDPSAIVDGWVSSSNDRGTIDILWSCCITIFLGCWVSAYPNIPSPDYKWYHKLMDKTWLGMISALGPEFMLGIACGQMSHAKRSVQLFKRDPALYEGRKWTYAHGFFLNMGGIFIIAPDFPDGFPIDAEQLFYLVKHKFVEFPDMAKMEIHERNSADTLSRLIALWQVVWFFVTEMERIAKGFPITSLELTALCYAIIMVATSICWFYKPSLQTPRYISTNPGVRIEDIREFAKRHTHRHLSDTWYRTPLDFISRRRFSIDCHWAYYARVSQIIHFPGISRPVLSRPWNRIPSDTWYPYSKDWIVLPMTLFLLIGFNTALMLSWNLHFPTRGETIMWRVCIIYIASFGVYGGAYYLLEMLAWYKEWDSETPDTIRRSATTHHRVTGTAVSRVSTFLSKRSTTLASSTEERIESNPLPSVDTSRRVEEGRARSRIYHAADRLRNNSIDQDPENAIPLRINLPLMLKCAIYIMVRLIIYAENFAALRSQPAGVYVAVNRFVPFLG